MRCLRFNWAARKLHKRLIQLGAHEAYLRGEADEQHPEGYAQTCLSLDSNLDTNLCRLDATYLPWSTDLRKHLIERLPLQDGIHPIPEDVLLQPRWTLSLLKDASSVSASSISNGSNPIATTNDFHVPCTERGGANAPASQVDVTPSNITMTLDHNTRLTPTTHWQDVRHLSFTTLEQVHYDAGDILTIHPKNASNDVEHLLEVMDWISMADKPIHLVPTGPESATHSYPPPPITQLTVQSSTTLRTLLTDHLDLTAIPRRSFFSFIAHFTNDPMHKDRLLEFTNPEYVDELYDYTTRPRRSILEVLQEFESVKIPWQWAVTVLPILRGRQFSIASGGRLQRGPKGGTCFELLVAIVKYRTVIKKIREGVCTKYIAALPVGSQISVTLQKGGLGITKTEARRPVITIGPGTGVAPIRSLIWERRQWADELESRSQANGSKVMNGMGSIGESVLFFGCRNQEADFFYGSEWEELQEKMPLQVFTAFSRDQKQKVYVQDLIRQQSKLLYRLLHASNGIIYICGSSGKMPQAVREALIEVFQTNMDRGAAEAYLLAMEKEGRYKQETW